MSGEELRRRRKQLGLTQPELAAALGVSVNTISRWELGLIAIGAPGAIDLALGALEKKAGRPRKPPG